MSSFLRNLIFGLLILAGAAPRSHAHGLISPEAGCRLLVQKYAPTESQLLEDSMIEVTSQGQWLRSDLIVELAHYQKQNAAFQEFLTRQAAGEKQRVFWIQQTSIKTLNEKVWSITGAESFLAILDQELRVLLELEPTLGALIHANYKDRVISSQQSPEAFRTTVFEPLMDRVALRLAEHFPEGRARQVWKAWLQKTLKIGSGPGLVEASLSVHGIRSTEQFEEWSRSTRRLGNILDARFQAAGIAWSDLLVEAKRVQYSVDGLSAWFRRFKIRNSEAQRLARDLIQYRKALQAIDFLPISPGQAPEIPWALSRSHFMRETLNAGTLIATDIQGFGIQAFLARHQWVLEGRTREEIPAIYDSTTRELEAFNVKVRRVLLEVLSPDALVHSYLSGDDGLWAIPTLDDTQLLRLQKGLGEISSLHFAVQKIETRGDFESAAQALMQVRKKLFGGKRSAP